MHSSPQKTAQNFPFKRQVKIHIILVYPIYIVYKKIQFYLLFNSKELFI